MAELIYKTVFTVVTGLLLLLVIPVLFGFQPCTVVSGSMEPKLPAGSLIYIRSCVFDEICTGDVITFHLDGSDALVTHRVKEIDRQKQLLVTKGDANRHADVKPVRADCVLGKVVWNLPYMGRFMQLLHSIRRKLILLLLLIAAIILKYISERNRNDKNG